MLIAIDCLFVAQIQLNNGNQLSPLTKWFLVSFGIFFVIVPLLCNLVQFHKETQVWMFDTYSKHTVTVQQWIRSYLRLLYMIAILCGSSFVAVDICNSNLFHLQMFNMCLNRRFANTST